MAWEGALSAGAATSALPGRYSVQARRGICTDEVKKIVSIKGQIKTGSN
jgi:hypothetical protein